MTKHNCFQLCKIWNFHTRQNRCEYVDRQVTNTSIINEHLLMICNLHFILASKGPHCMVTDMYPKQQINSMMLLIKHNVG